jgi:hypothetical protein
MITSYDLQKIVYVAGYTFLILAIIILMTLSKAY